MHAPTDIARAQLKTPTAKLLKLALVLLALVAGFFYDNQSLRRLTPLQLSTLTLLTPAIALAEAIVLGALCRFHCRANASARVFIPLIGSLFFGSAHANAAQQTPERNCAEVLKKDPISFKVGQSSASKDKLHVQLQISVAPGASAGEPLIRLACQLNARYPAAQSLDASIFDDELAAKRFVLGFTEAKGYGNYLWHLRGHYKLDRRSGEQYLEYSYPEWDDWLLKLGKYKVRLE